VIFKSLKGAPRGSGLHFRVSLQLISAMESATLIYICPSREEIVERRSRERVNSE
jgi:hypothetical protein